MSANLRIKMEEIRGAKIDNLMNLINVDEGVSLNSIVVDESAICCLLTRFDWRRV